MRAHSKHCGQLYADKKMPHKLKTGTGKGSWRMLCVRGAAIVARVAGFKKINLKAVLYQRECLGKDGAGKSAATYICGSKQIEVVQD